MFSNLEWEVDFYRAYYNRNRPEPTRTEQEPTRTEQEPTRTEQEPSRNQPEPSRNRPELTGYSVVLTLVNKFPRRFNFAIPEKFIVWVYKIS